MTTMIALVGEQQLPNYLPIRQHDSPTHVLLVYTKRTAKPQYENLKAVLEQKKVIVSGKETEQKIKVFGVKTDPYDISAIIAAIYKELDQNKEFAQARQESLQPPVINWTGGTKVMSLAAYHIAQQDSAPMIYLQSEGKNTRMYHYIWEDRQLRSNGSELLPECMTLRDVFDLQFGPGRWQELGSNRRTTDQRGKLFEQALAATLAESGYEVMVGVRGLGGQIDIDIAVRSGNQYGIIEAKTGAGVRTLEGIQQLHTAAKHLGTYSQTFYVSTGEPVPTQKELIEVSNIQVISILNYDGTSNPLASEDAEKLLSAVKKTLKG